MNQTTGILGFRLLRYGEEMKKRNKEYIRKLALKLKACLESD
jgi:hypothetical protein